MNILYHWLVLLFTSFALIMCANHVDAWLAIFGTILLAGVWGDIERLFN